MAHQAIKLNPDNREQLAQVQSTADMPGVYSYQTLQRAPTKTIADLEWQVRFTQMKLNAWRDSDDLAWKRLKALNEEASSKLAKLTKA